VALEAEGEAIESRRAISIRRMELDTAKEILVFHARTGEVEDMIQRRSLGYGILSD